MIIIETTATKMSKSTITKTKQVYQQQLQQQQQ